MESSEQVPGQAEESAGPPPEQAEPASDPGQDQPPKPETEDVNPVEEHELDSLEDEGAADVNEQSEEEAAQDDTVDNEENDTGDSNSG